MRTRKNLLFGAAGFCLILAQTAEAQISITIPAEDLTTALNDYIRQTGVQLIYSVDDVAGLTSGSTLDLPRDAALAEMLAGTGLKASRDKSGAVVISRIGTHNLNSTDDLPAVETVVVTGSRIRSTSEPSTPVIAVTAKALRTTTPGGIPEALDKLPIFMGGSTPNNAATGANGRGNNAPGYFLNLRNLGAIRTLILEDGHRVPGTFYDTNVDVDMLPQMLMQRVEIVTGGASAVYGSDAVTGVVNFILDKKFTGFKAEAQAGVSGYGDTRGFQLGIAGGHEIGAHAHLLWSLEYRDRAALPDVASRPLGNLGTSIVGAGTTVSPYTLVTNIRQSNTAPGGLIVSGPGKGLQFASDGSLVPFNAGIPTATTNFAIGGDGGIAHNEYLLPAFRTGQAFVYYSQEIGTVTSHFEARYAQARSFEASQIFTNTSGSGLTTNGSGAQYPITIYTGNAFLSLAQQTFLFPTGGPASFQMNRMDNDLMSRLSLDQHTGALALGAGLDGTVWHGAAWDLNYTHGETRTQLTTRNNVDTARFYAALDAVKDPTSGNIVCNVSLTTPGAFPGCAPLNLFGQSATQINGSNASQAALNYVVSTTWWVAHNGLDDFSANITGTALESWAGPVKFAVGIEYRLASLNVTTSTPDNSFKPQYLRLAPPGTFAASAASPDGSFPLANLANFKEVQSGARGSENISEANIEFDVPLARAMQGLEWLSVNGAARYTQYHVGGLDPVGGAPVKASFSASTWKLGMEWQVLDTVRLRASTSRDIRAPTLWDLFQGPVTTTSGISDSLTGTSGSVNTKAIGNPGLKPEVARSTTLGGIFNPSGLGDFKLSVDYFHIEIGREIAPVSGNNPIIQPLCAASGGTSQYCALIVRPISYSDTSPLNFPVLFNSQTQNFQTQWTEGFDVEANYRGDLQDFSPWQGALVARLLWTHVAFLKTLGLPGSVITDVAGSANAPGTALPADKIVLTTNYAWNGFSLDLMERFYGPLRQNPNPALIYALSTGDLPAWFQTDATITFDFAGTDMPFSAFLSVSNVFDSKPGIFQVPTYTGSPGLNYPVVPYEDIVGRYVTFGLRLNLGDF